jgi:hypothetical protein
MLPHIFLNTPRAVQRIETMRQTTPVVESSTVISIFTDLKVIRKSFAALVEDSLHHALDPSTKFLASVKADLLQMSLIHTSLTTERHSTVAGYLVHSASCIKIGSASVVYS